MSDNDQTEIDPEVLGLTQIDRDVLALARTGMRQAQIAEKLGVNKQRVSQVIKRLRTKRGIALPEPRRGQPRKTPL